MATINAVDNTLPSPFTIGATSVTSTGTQLNYLAGLTAVPINKVNIQVITATGSSTYTPTAGMVFAIAEIVGGGGGSGGTTAAGGTAAASAGGGGGGYCRKFYTAALLGANATVVIGTGGTAGSSGNNTGGNGVNSTFTPAGAGAILTASGGTGGAGSADSATFAFSGAGGTGGTGTNGDINIPGGNGAEGITINGATNTLLPGTAGNSMLSPVGLNNVTAVSVAAKNYGGGAPGIYNNTNANAAGTAGAQGVCIITEFISA